MLAYGAKEKQKNSIEPEKASDAHCNRALLNGKGTGCGGFPSHSRGMADFPAFTTGAFCHGGCNGNGWHVWGKAREGSHTSACDVRASVSNLELKSDVGVMMTQCNRDRVSNLLE